MERLRGLIAATFTPLREDGSLDLDRVEPMVDRLFRSGLTGIYINGSTGEGVSLTSAERIEMADAFIAAARGRLKTVVQVGHNSLPDACALAEQAASAGADAISASPPSHFKPESIGALVDTVAAVAAAAPGLPFYYYHIPSVTGVRTDLVDFLGLAARAVPSLAGVKYSDPNLAEFIACQRLEDGRFDLVFGVDEMLLAGLATGARGAVGSTYNFAAPAYLRLLAAFERGDLQEARLWQARAAEMVRVIIGAAGRAGLKATMALVGQGCGPHRLPIQTATPAQVDALRAGLERIGFFEWAMPDYPDPLLA